MTCIVGLKAKGKVYIGADSAGSGGGYTTIRADEKVFKKDGFIFGFTGSYRVGQVVRYAFKVPANIKSCIDEYMVVDFVNAFRACLKDAGCLTTENGADESIGSFLIGCKASGELYSLQSDLQIGKSFDSYDTTGSGHALAIGSMYSNGHIKDPKKRVLNALNAAQQFSTTVRGPMVVLSI